MIAMPREVASITDLCSQSGCHWAIGTLPWARGYKIYVGGVSVAVFAPSAASFTKRKVEFEDSTYRKPDRHKDLLYFSVRIGPDRWPEGYVAGY